MGLEIRLIRILLVTLTKLKSKLNHLELNYPKSHVNDNKNHLKMLIEQYCMLPSNQNKHQKFYGRTVHGEIFHLYTFGQNNPHTGLFKSLISRINIYA